MIVGEHLRFSPTGPLSDIMRRAALATGTCPASRASGRPRAELVQRVAVEHGCSSGGAGQAGTPAFLQEHVVGCGR